MKRLNIFTKALLIAAVTASSGLASAAGSTTLAVTATVIATCKFSATSTPLAFGNIDPSATGNATASASVLYKCTKGTPSAGVTATGGLSRNMVGSVATDLLPYTLALTGGTQTGTGFGTGQDLTLAVAGTITPAQFQNAQVGAYTENVTLNITP